MNDKSSTAPIGHQIRLLRHRRGWTLAELARRAGTSGPTLHRYENGWDRFELQTVRRIAAALGARVEIRLVAPEPPSASVERPTADELIEQLAPLFWDRDLKKSDFSRHPDWILERVLSSGNRTQVEVARAFFGDDALRRALRRRGVDTRTRQYWRLMLGTEANAPQSS